MNIIKTGRRCILILAALFIAACQTAPQDGTIKDAKSENVKTVETVETAETSEPKLICVRERPTGSHFTKKVVIVSGDPREPKALIQSGFK